MVSFQMRYYDKVELIDPDSPDGDLTVIIYNWETDDDCDEEANFEVSRADARTLGTLLLRFADTGSTDIVQVSW